ncbi:TonB-dependent receptor [Luminiphilus syltensis NOR5-1B]|uniref:TonB-dependent receptor n=1 Tax=Luminiphilus syltensis NOR5-1B TaxID=565045 RepID=B8KQH9_9GAMM|nr:TonB-dependent receptor [Luminiphilus syltensis]EED34784.1 TonB-dependent receptor [Luminiphilus syltensis NOR5-1B]
MRNKILNASLAFATCSLAAAVSQVAMAQVDEASNASAGLEEVVVTARKRTENLQDVGLSVSAMTGSEIEATFARDIKDLAFISPNLIIDDTSQGPGGNAAMYIRGIGVADVEKNFEPAVGVQIDGLFIGANSGALLRSIDLASVEVLRGPQGTLFGRNTIGGTINIDRTRPTGELGGKVRAGYGNFGHYWLDGVVNFGITDNLALKLSGAKNDLSDGYFDNVSTGEDEGMIDYESYGINLLWNATENLEIEYTYTDEETVQDTPPLVNMAQPDTLFCGAFDLCAESVSVPSSGDRYNTNRKIFEPLGVDRDPGSLALYSTDTLEEVDPPATFNAETHIFDVRWSITDALQMDYIYGTFETEETIVSNWTAEPVVLFGTDRPAEYKQESHELRFTYDDGGRLKLVAGGYHWDSSYDIRLRSWVTFIVPGTIFYTPQDTRQTTDSQALFFEGDYALSDRLTLTLGGRYTKDEKVSRQRGNLSTGPDDPSADWSEFTPKVGARYQIDDDKMLYATWAQGYRSGGFNGRVDSQDSARIPYDPEFVDNYELGFKTEWMDGTLRLNGALFYMDYEDKQEEIGLPSEGSTGQRISVFNAATATMQGVELEMQALINENLTLRGNIGYLDSEYDDFTFFNGFEEVDNSGFDFRRAPDFTGSMSATYAWEIGDGEASIRGSYRYLGEHFIEQSNRLELKNDDQHFVDLSANYSINGLVLSVFGRNLTEEDGWAHGLNVSGLWAYASARAPRTYGAEVTYNFGAN